MLGGDGGAVGEDDGGVHLALRDHLDELAVLFFRGCGDERARGGFGLQNGGDVGFFALEHVVMHDQVREDVAVETMGAGGVEGAVAKAAGGVDGGEGGEVEVRSDDHVEGGEVLGRAEPDGLGIDEECDTGIELSNLGSGGLCSLRRSIISWRLWNDSTYIEADMLLFDKELRSEIIFGHKLLVLDGHRSNASKDKVLCDLICKGLHAN